eukprot:TRINITY_DN11120_c0_g1_i1.p1 TRINITY_DN11120_c0_g1~~TRINITY_DN11120_c0_g1_i1.p1  ORF type:complete len:245 (+),score=33.21 TRINITY_DN11120_c0_g1_i1:744-1478(+)
MFSIMDRLWKKEAMDLGLILYNVVSTAENSGWIEVVPNSTTTATIHKDAGGPTAAFSKKPLRRWLKLHNNTTETFLDALNNFVRSCAAYSVATYVIGIGDRHNDNIMITEEGHLFHIDFGHFLGNIVRFGFYDRESAPFVLTPEYVYVMGGETSSEWTRYKELCIKGYNILRKKAYIFLSLFKMMLSIGIPQLTKITDLHYLRNAFSLGLSETEASMNFLGLIEKSLECKRTQFNFFFHSLAHK